MHQHLYTLIKYASRALSYYFAKLLLKKKWYNSAPDYSNSLD